jgi:putative chitinase
MKLTPELLNAATRCGPSIASLVAGGLDAAMQKFSIVSPKRAAAFLAQLAQESGNFSSAREDMVYTRPETLMRTWPSRFPSIEFANQYVRSPEKLANYVYCNRLGNGPIGSGDGWRFRGGGFSQITGRATWTQCSAAIGIDLLGEPNIISRPSVSSMTAGWFWSENGLLLLADRGDLDGYKMLTRRLNGGLVGFEDGNTWGNDDRVERWVTAKLAFGIQ